MNDQHAGLAGLPGEGPMMTLIEVAEYLKVHKITMYRTIKAGGKLSQLKIDRIWRFRRQGVVQFADGGSGAALR